MRLWCQSLCQPLCSCSTALFYKILVLLSQTQYKISADIKLLVNPNQKVRRNYHYFRNSKWLLYTDLIQQTKWGTDQKVKDKNQPFMYLYNLFEWELQRKQERALILNLDPIIETKYVNSLLFNWASSTSLILLSILTATLLQVLHWATRNEWSRTTLHSH